MDIFAASTLILFGLWAAISNAADKIIDKINEIKKEKK